MEMGLGIGDEQRGCSGGEQSRERRRGELGSALAGRERPRASAGACSKCICGRTSCCVDGEEIHVGDHHVILD